MPTNAQVILTPSTLPEGACYASEQERHNAYAEHLSGALPGTYATVNAGPDAPAANDRNAPWARTNPDGSPDGTYFYFNGTWKRTHPLAPGLIMMWMGSAAAVDALDGGAAGVVTTSSGPFWEIVTALAGKFPVGVGTFVSGLAVAVNGTGGEERVTLETKHLPEVLGRLGTNVDKLYTNVSSGGSSSPNGGANSHDGRTLAEAILGGTADVDKSHNNLPPYVGAYFLKRTARIWYSI